MRRLEDIETFGCRVITILSPSPTILMREVDRGEARKSIEQQNFMGIKASRKIQERPTSPIARVVPSADISQSEKSFICYLVHNLR